MDEKKLTTPAERMYMKHLKNVSDYQKRNPEKMREKHRQKMEKIKGDPVLYEAYKKRHREYERRFREKKKAEEAPEPVNEPVEERKEEIAEPIPAPAPAPVLSRRRVI